MTAPPFRVLVTRPAADAVLLAEALTRSGIEVLSEPLLEIVNIPGQPVAVEDVQALLITSANGIRVFAARNAARDLLVLAVGDASAAAARGLGFARVESAAGDVAALARLCQRQLDPAQGELLHVAGTRIAGDLAQELRQAGFRYRREELYRARAATALSSAAVAAVRAGTLAGVLFFSPRTAETFVALAGVAGATAHLARMTAYCLSRAVATKAGAAAWKRIVVAEEPSQDSLLAAIARDML
ncbi:MAG: uroporphyrinogen-III synthase [Rhodospirillales bacterium]|nr:uroporphyrinogen-III synthase [Rhodospirillales bacterium]MSP80971.1 uroporphyrinogen-III synthase [Rhodospirillales bacterium]